MGAWGVKLPSKVEHACPRCAGEMVVRTNRRERGKFLGCMAFPKCRGTRELDGSECPIQWGDVFDPNDSPWAEWDGADGWGSD
jgi:ssDNA-binding Zn-finger/Zn-ribbon topoisomerase 1